ncbi:MAG: TIGR04190 family B12-binding domain/radical SAM domain protein [Deltaproteobacteria bacterium]|nr:TIGR04190 family B12-binding domain/radical SAM domain protein [Deltaproteobacteria bacterium]MBW2309199.1 TIGR04190 family B12-binding domain/radical SAM domain protein [Deltaproteobacteria bacterium]
MFNFQTDLVLLHAPSVYDFRRESIMFGPISDVIPSTTQFEMYPVGFSSLVEYLGRHGFGVRILNLAYRMVTNPQYDVEKELARVHTRAFGIDLHWLPHAHGSVEIARICKRLHPRVPVIFGGYSATYFHRELIHYPEVDFIVRGDSTEEPMAMLMKAMNGRGELENIPNLTWKDNRGEVRVNPLTHVPADLDGFGNNYRQLFRNALKFMDIRGMTPIHDWWEYPITAVITCRGCTHDCSFCGGAHSALKEFAVRPQPAWRSPERIAEDIARVGRYTNAPIFVVGDIRQPGDDYARAVLNTLRPLHVKNHVVLELFNPAPEEHFDLVAGSLTNFNLEISPDSHDEAVRRAVGKRYVNDAMEDNIRWALDRGCSKMDLFFMIGLPMQDTTSVMDTVEYAGSLMERFGPRLNPFISPLAPFLDPGSPAYERPDHYGYAIRFRRLEEYRQALLQPSWKQMLNYETRWMTRDQIVDSTYEAALRLNRLKQQHGFLDEQTFRLNQERILLARQTVRQIDDILALPNSRERSLRLQALKAQMNRASMDTICWRDEIRWPVLRRNFNFFHIAWDILFDSKLCNFARMTGWKGYRRTEK